MDIALRPVEPRDIPALYAVHRDAMGDYVVATWGTWDPGLQRRFFEDRLARGRMQVVEVDGALAGIWETSERKSSLHLENVELASWVQRMGIGTRLVSGLQQQAEARDMPVTLQVLLVNPAFGLYRRLGFFETGRDATHIKMRWEPQQQ